MKISELIKKTGVSKETIHYYIREGLLPKARKTGKNTSEYDNGYIDKIQTIKSLQENFFLPLSAIKKIMKEYKKQPQDKQFHLEFMSEYFRPFDLLFAKEIHGKEAFVKETGIGENWLDKMELWGIITFRIENSTRVYSNDDAIIARLVVNMDVLGFGPKEGYDPSMLTKYFDLFSRLISEGSDQYIKKEFKKIPPEDFIKKGAQYSELLALFSYYLFRKMVKERFLSFSKAEFENGEKSGTANK